MFPFRKRILRKVDCRGLAVLERDLLEAVVGLSAATTTDLCIRWQLEELLGYQEEARRSDGAWFEREWVENYGRRGCYYELPAVKIVQVPQIGGRWSHPSVTLPRVWSYSVLTDKSRSLGLTLKMCGWIGEICLYGFERRELRYNYPVDTSCEVSPVVSSRSEPDVCVAVPDDRLRLLLDAVTATLSEHSKPKNRIIVSAPFTAETLGEYRLSRTVRSLFAFSNGMRINDLLIYELDGFMGVRHGYFDGARYTRTRIHLTDRGEYLEVGEDNKNGNLCFLPVQEGSVGSEVFKLHRGGSGQLRRTSMDFTDYCLSFLNS